MSSFTTLKKNSRFESACPSSGPVTFCEGGPGHVHMRSPRGLTRGFLHQPRARIKSRIASTCPSSGPATFCEGGPGHVHMRSPRGLTRGFLHQPRARIKSRIASTCPSSGPATFCEGSRPRLRTQPGHVHARSRRVHARSFRCTNLVQFSLRLSRNICCSCPTVLGGAPLGQ